MDFRKADKNDIDRVMEIFDAARKRMATLGIDQWQDGYPQRELILEDIVCGRSYVGEKDGTVVATVMIMTDNEPTYDKIYEGEWLCGGEYLTIHRIALDGAACGTGAAAKTMAFAEAEAKERGVKSVRVDTHRGNIPMRKNLEKNGYSYCGIIYLENGDERVAYQKILEKKMKIKDGYLLRKVADSYIAVSVGAQSDGRLVRMNGTGAFLWETIKNGADENELVNALMEKYSIDKDTAATAVTGFVEKLRKEDLLA